MYLFHKTIAIKSTCLTKPSAKYISVSQDHCYKTYLFYRTMSKDMNQIQKTIIKKLTCLENHHKENVHISKAIITKFTSFRRSIIKKIYLFQKTITTKMLLFHRTIIRTMYLFHKTIIKKMRLFEKTITTKNVAVSQDQHTENVHISKDHQQGHYHKIYIFHKTITTKMDPD